MSRFVTVLGLVLVVVAMAACTGASPGPGSAARPTGRATAVATGTGRPSTLSLFVEPDDGDAPVVQLLRSARRSIRMVVYLLSERDVISELKDAKGRGVDVRVMLEKNPTGGGEGNKAVYDELTAAKIMVNWSNPSFRLTHEKAVVVDDQVALIGSMNYTRSSFTKNREYGFIDREPRHVTEVAAVFDADWLSRRANVTDTELVWSPVNARAKLLGLIDGAKRSLYVEAEEMQDGEIEDHLINASRRGVQVRVVISPPQSGADLNTPGLDKIRRGGVQIHFLADPYIHAKMMVADTQQLFVGSENLSTASLDFNRELGLLINAPDFANRLEETFAKDWAGGKALLFPPLAPSNQEGRAG